MAESEPENPRRALLAGASAAKTLRKTCETSLKAESSLKIRIVHDLAHDMQRHLETFADGDIPSGLLAEAAQKCADLATLAACNAEELEDPRVSEAVRLAAEAAISLSGSLENDSSEDSPNDYVRRDARSAAWKASLAARQIME